MPPFPDPSVPSPRPQLTPFPLAVHDVHEEAVRIKETKKPAPVPVGTEAHEPIPSTGVPATAEDETKPVQTTVA